MEGFLPSRSFPKGAHDGLFRQKSRLLLHQRLLSQVSILSVPSWGPMLASRLGQGHARVVPPLLSLHRTALPRVWNVSRAVGPPGFPGPNVGKSSLPTCSGGRFLSIRFIIFRCDICVCTPEYEVVDAQDKSLGHMKHNCIGIFFPNCRNLSVTTFNRPQTYVV
jgi:hypothetical protein